MSSASGEGLLEELIPILEKLKLPAQRQNMPERVELCRRVLEIIGRHRLNPVNDATAQALQALWAFVQVELGDSLAENPSGEPTENLELAIAAYQKALEVYTPQAFPKDWARTQYNLGLAYWNRILGERVENLELAIAAWKAALEVYTHEAFPQDWAGAQTLLGIAYQNRSRILGERAENLKDAMSSASGEGLPEELAQILEKLKLPAQPQDMPERVELCRRALEIIGRHRLNPVWAAMMTLLWAAVQVELGTSLAQDPSEEREENLELAIAAYQAALEVYTPQAFPQEWAGTQNNLGLAYSDRILGERVENLELAIAAYQKALEVYTPQAFQEEWAKTQYNLGGAYQNRIRGERAENLELAIAAWKAALEVFTPQAFPQEWARTQYNLGDAYQNRILGERAENLELAIAAYQKALEVYTPREFLKEWATTQNHLGIAYSHRILGERAENLELAIAAYQKVLETRTPQVFPEDWAMTQNNLGIAHSDRIRGERAENLELAIAAFQAAMEVYTPQAFPQEWAGAQNNLGNAYRDRILGERAENLELAIAAFQKALEVYTRQVFPREWATTQNHLGNAYQDRILGKRAENLELAIAAYQKALEIRTPQAFPEDWAMTQNNLGNAYQDRIRGERAENLELAIAAYQKALEIRTPQAFPQEWAKTQYNLGNAYQDRILGKRAENLELAIAAYQKALKVYTPQAFPQEWAGTQDKLGIAYSDRILGERADNLERAITAWREVLNQRAHMSLQAIDSLYLARQTTDITRQLIRALILKSEARGALEAAEAAKATSLRLQLTRTNRPPANLTAQEAQEYHRLVQCVREIASERRGLEHQQLSPIDRTAKLTDLGDRYAQASSRLRELVASNPDFMLRPADYTTICTLASQANLTLVFLHPTDDSDLGTLAFLVHPDSPLEAPARDDVLQLAGLTAGELSRFLFQMPPGFRRDGEEVGQSLAEEIGQLLAVVLGAEGHSELGWLSSYWIMHVAGSSQYEPAVRALWQDTMLRVLEALSRPLSPIAARLRQLRAHRIVFIPSNLLAFLPLHAVPLQLPEDEEGKQGTAVTYFGDAFEIAYAPSATSLAHCWQRMARRQASPTPSLVAVDNPDGSLIYSDAQVGAIANRFDGRAQVASGAAAKREWLFEHAPEADFLELSTHGAFDLGESARSEMLLAGCEKLLLDDIWAGRLLLKEGCRITASACETAQIQPTNSGEESLGFPAAFLGAGAASVIASLWEVDDLCTALLMDWIYELMLPPQALTPPAALRQAGQRLRRLSKAEALAHLQAQLELLEHAEAEGCWEALSLDEYAARYYRLGKLKERYYLLAEGPDPPFAHPFFWSAFAAYGI
jgi:CHAT domain-containing protein/tetratricopeptide (TPR) repeat protein